MGLDQPASSEALWEIYDATGVRPEYVLPVLYSESGFRPEIVNSLGYSGLNQISAGWLTRHNIAPADYITWPASQQLRRVVLPFTKENIAYLKVTPHSGTRYYQLNFWPASLRYAVSLGDDLRLTPTAYKNNAGFDTAKKGYVTVGDLATFVAKAAKATPVQAAIAAAYAVRPEETPRDPVYGTDFGVPEPARRAAAGMSNGIALAWGVGLVAVAGAAAYALRRRRRA